MGQPKVGAILKVNVVRRGRTSEGNPEDRIRHHPDEEKGEVDSGELVTGPGGLRAGMRDEFRGEGEEGGAEDEGDREVDGVECGREKEERDARERDDRG